MKKILFIILALFILLNTIAYSTCQSPYSTLNTSVWVQGCEFNIEVCYLCPGAGSNGEIRLNGWNKVDPSCPLNLDANQIYAAICDQIYDHSWILANICQDMDNNLKPCEQGGVYIEYVYHRCFVKYNEGNGIFRYYPCWSGGCLCREVWKYCWTPIPPPFGSITQELYWGPERSCNYDCPDDEPDNSMVPPNTESSCFHLATPCDPW